MQFFVLCMSLISLSINGAAFNGAPAGRSRSSDQLTLIGYEPNEVTLKQVTQSKKSTTAVEGTRITRRISTLYYILISGTTPERREHMVDNVVSLEKPLDCGCLFQAFMEQLSLQELTSEQYVLLSKPEVSILEKHTESVIPQKKAVGSPPISRCPEKSNECAQYKEQNCTRFDLGTMQMMVPNAATAQLISDFLARPNIREFKRRGEVLAILKDLCQSIKPSAVLISDAEAKKAFESQI